MEKLQEIWKKNKKAFIILGVVALAYAGYSFFTGGEDSDGFTLDYSPSVGTYDTGIGQSIIKTLNELRRVKLDVSIFDDDVFKSLVDRKVATTSVPLGRIDPFAPTKSEEDI